MISSLINKLLCSNTIIYPRTMMIIYHNTLLTNITMLWSPRSN